MHHNFFCFISSHTASFKPSIFLEFAVAGPNPAYWLLGSTPTNFALLSFFILLLLTSSDQLSSSSSLFFCLLPKSFSSMLLSPMKRKHTKSEVNPRSLNGVRLAPSQVDEFKQVEGLLDRLPSGYDYALEFRHGS